MEKTQIQCYNQRTKEIPSFVEKQNSGKPYLNYGNNNQFPQYLWELYLKSAILQSIINGSADYVMGSNIQTTITIADKVNKDLETLEDISIGILKNSASMDAKNNFDLFSSILCDTNCTYFGISFL